MCMSSMGRRLLVPRHPSLPPGSWEPGAKQGAARGEEPRGSSAELAQGPSSPFLSWAMVGPMGSSCGPGALLMGPAWKPGAPEHRPRGACKLPVAQRMEGKW